MDALLDDDVGIAVGEKFANTTKKAFAKQHDIKAVEKKKEAHKKPRKLLSLITLTVTKIT